MLNAFKNNNVDCVGGVTIQKLQVLLVNQLLKHSRHHLDLVEHPSENVTDGEYVDTLAFGVTKVVLRILEDMMKN